MRSVCRRLSLALTIPLALCACDTQKQGDEHAAASAESGDSHGESESEHEAGDCAAEMRDDDFAIGLSKSGNLVQATFVSANPAPPIKGDNTWVLEFRDLDNQPLSDLNIVVVPMMPDHGHGTPIDAEVRALETPGHYEISPVNLFMTGYWEINFEIELAGGGQDSLMFGFCVE